MQNSSSSSPSTSSTSVSVGLGVSVPATSVSVASSIPSITISRVPNQKIPVIPLINTASSTFGKKKLNNSTMSSSIPPVVHTYSRPRILGRGREVNNRSPGKILQQQITPPTNNSIAIASTSTTSTEFGKSLLVSSSSNSTATTTNIQHNQNPSFSQPINNSSHIVTTNPTNNANIANSFLNGVNVIASNVSSSGCNNDVVNINANIPSILIGASPPSKSPPASKLIVRLPSLSPVAATAVAAAAVEPVPVPVAMPMQITDIQVVDEAEMINEVVQSVVQVEIDYQTLVALNTMEPTEETFNIHDGVVEEMEIDRTTAVLNVDRNSPKPVEERTYVISQDEDTQVINFIEINSNENIGETACAFEESECKHISMEISENGGISAEEQIQKSIDIQAIENVVTQQVIQLDDDDQQITEIVVLKQEPQEEINSQSQVNITIVAQQNDPSQSVEIKMSPKAQDDVEIKTELMDSEFIIEQSTGAGSICQLVENQDIIPEKQIYIEIKLDENNDEAILEQDKDENIAMDISQDDHNEPEVDVPVKIVSPQSVNTDQDVVVDATAETIVVACEELAEQAHANLKIEVEDVPTAQENSSVETKNSETPDSDQKLESSNHYKCDKNSTGSLNVITSAENQNISIKLEKECEEEVPAVENNTKDEKEVCALVSEVATTEEHIVPAEMNHNSSSGSDFSSSKSEKDKIPPEIHSDEIKVEKCDDISKAVENMTVSCLDDKIADIQNTSSATETVKTEKQVCEVQVVADTDTSKALEVLSKEAQLSSTSAVAVASPSDEIDMATEKTEPANQTETEAVMVSPVKSETVSSCDADEMVNTDKAPLNPTPTPSSSKEEGKKSSVVVDNISSVTETACKKQSSEATLIPRIPIADEAYNNAEDETDKIVAAKVPINEYEAQVVEPAEPEPANIRVVEQPPVFRCLDLLDEPPDEVELEGKAALQWRNGIGSLPGSNLKFKMNDLGVMELIVQEDENENEVADMEVDVDDAAAAGCADADAEEKCIDEKSNVYENGVESNSENAGDRLECGKQGRLGFESSGVTDNDEHTDSKSDRSGSRSPEYYLKPPPRTKFSIMSNLKNSPAPVPPPALSPEMNDTYDGDGDADEEEIDTCLWCGKFGLKSELTNSKCVVCVKAVKKKTKTRPSPAPSQSESTSEENFKIPKKPYVPYKSAYPIIPRNTMTMKLQHLTETITTTMTNSAAIVLGIKDKAVMDSLSAGIGLSCSKFIQESKSKALKNGLKKVRNAGNAKKAALKERKRSPEASGKEMPHLGSPEKSSCDEKEDGSEEMPLLKVNEVEFEWPKYLTETKSKAAPQRLFRQPAFPPENPFQCNMVLEAIDPQHQSLFCLVVVVETQGYRMRLRFVGSSEIFDFWMNADSLEIFPCGWCEDHNYKVERPPGASSPFDWKKYSRVHGYTVAPNEFFAILKEEPLSDSGVEVGMKLEAVDIRNQNLVCVATVANVMGDRFLVHFDSWDTLYDYWTDVTSPFIHPVGWCEENNVELTPPNNFKTKFSWESYLRSTKCAAMPTKLFQPLPPVGFKKGMKLECVDKRNPFLVRVATIVEIEGHEFVIHFDNWPQIYDYKVYELSPDIHPVGWCNHTGHPLQSPPPLEGEWDGACKTFGCIGLGNMKGPKFISHNTEKYCPYSLSNYKQEENGLPDRIVVYERNYGPQEKDESFFNEVNAKVNKKTSKRPVEFKSEVVTGKRKRTSVTKESLGAVAPVPVLLLKSQPGTSTSTNVSATNSNQPVVPLTTSQPQQTTNGAPIMIIIPTPVPFGQSPFIAGPQVQTPVPCNSDSTEEPAPKRRRLSQTSTESSSKSTVNTEEEAFHSQDQNYHDVSLKVLVDKKDESQVRKWKTKDVVDFVSRIPGCKEAANLLVEHEIDGESFLLLTQNDLIKVMGFKMGPAVKLTNAIRLIYGNSGKSTEAAK